MTDQREQIIIPVDDIYELLVDKYNWEVNRRDKKGGYHNTFHPNLTQAIERIVQNKTIDSGDAKDLRTYMAWYQTTIQAVANRVLSQRKLIEEAFKLNKVM